MPPKKGEGEDPPETLASASGKNVEGLLNRVSRRRGGAGGGQAPGLPGVLPPPRRRGAAAAGACGAPAVADLDAEPEKPSGSDAEGDPESHRPAAPLLASAPAADPDSDGGDWEECWEDVRHDEDDVGVVPKSDQPGNSAGGITVSLDGAAAIAGPSAARRGRAFTKEDREIAREVHRAHLLCLLGRGLLYDAAAADPLLQAVMLSLVPPSVASQTSKVHSTVEDIQQEGLEAMVGWFRGAFKLLRAPAVAPLAEGEDEIAAAIARAKGLPAVVSHLVGVAERREGTAEELATVFAAALRALGLAARCVRLLEPSSLKPGDALRQRENAVKEFMKRPSRRQAAEPVSLVAQAAADLIAGTASQRLENLRDQVAAQLGVEPGAVNVKPGKGRGGPLSITLDRRKLRKKESGSGGKKAAGRGGGASGAGPKVAVGPEGDKDESQRGVRGRKRKAAAAEAGAGGGAEGDDGVIDLTGDGGGAAHTEGAGGGNKKRKAATAKAENDAAALPNGGVPLQAVQERQQGPKGRKRKCDEELERQLEVAMAATAFETRRQEESAAAAAAGAQDSPAGPSVPKRPARGGGGSGGGGGSARGAAFGAHQGHVGRYWLELYCGSATSGRWVHVCPISGWVDRAADVEGLAPRGQPLAYVVALGGSGGAKDVTRRYASSFLGAQKHRDEGWWGETMGPLARREAAAAAALHGAPPAAPAPAAAAPVKVAAGKPPPAPLAAAREDRELEQRAAAERAAVPTTIADFKAHKDLILDRHIGKHQALRSGSKPVGSHRGEAYYLRTDVGEVHTVERWRRLGREVLPAELDRPAKRLKKRQQGGGGRGGRGGGRFAGPRKTLNPWEGLEEDGGGEEGGDGGVGVGGSGEGEEAGTSAFYGIWQTREWAPPAAQGGRVPKNERGNVEVPPLAAALPAGTVHLRLAAGAVCRKLGIDYAPALTGFDIRAGRSVPSLEGVVVCAEHAEAVKVAFEEEEALKAARAREKRMTEAEKTWQGLLGALLTRVQLARAYGGGGAGGADGGAPATAEGEAAAMLVHTAGNGKLPAPSGGGKKRGYGEGQAAEEGGGDAYAAAAADVEMEEI